MALDDLLKNEAARNIAIGVAASAVAYALLPTVARVGRPFARAAVKTGIIVYEKARETAAEVGEVMEDLIAEARAEMDKDNVISTQKAVDPGKETSQGVEIEIE